MDLLEVSLYVLIINTRLYLSIFLVNKIVKNIFVL